MPFINGASGRQTAWATGCSMGGFHAANFFFRRPDLFDGVIAMSGVYQPRMFVGDYSDDDVYFNSPSVVPARTADPWHLERYRRSRIIFCVGQGAWEDAHIPEMRHMQEILHDKQIPATFDYWGHDVEHHWYWWQKMLRHHLQGLWSRLTLPDQPPCRARCDIPRGGAGRLFATSAGPTPLTTDCDASGGTVRRGDVCGQSTAHTG